MTIYLPKELMAFREAFSNACDRVIASKQDQVFYSLCAALIEALQTNPLVCPYFLELGKTAEQLNNEFRSAALEAFEEEWIMLWSMHPKNGSIRKALMRIKRSVTHPYGFTFSTLFDQTNFSLLQLRFLSSFCEPQRAALLQDSRFNEHLVSHKRMELISKASIAGNDTFEKRRGMQAIAEINPLFCWNRMIFFQRCWHFKEVSIKPKAIKGEWASIRESAWQAAWETCDQIVLWAAKIDLNNSLNAKPDTFFPSPFLNAEHQIIRSDYEGFLLALKHHLYDHLLKLESMQAEQKVEETPLLTLPGSQKGAFVIDLAQKFWKANPLGKQDEAYEYYQTHCPYNKLLKRDRWEQIVRERKLDPRPKEAKKRGPGKKTLQN